MDTYNSVIQKGVNGYTATQLQEIAMRNFSRSLRGRTKKEKFDELLNLFYQRSYTESIKRVYESHEE